MPARTRREKERRATESPMPGRSGFSDADRGELLRVHTADKPHCGKKGSKLELGELDLQVADKPVNLAHARPTML